jgi:hypothetical protein
VTWIEIGRIEGLVGIVLSLKPIEFKRFMVLLEQSMGSKREDHGISFGLANL